MRLPGRLAAAIEVLTDLETRHRPAAEALKDWGIAHRFAGSGDRAAIGNLVYDALRKRLSSAHFAGADTPRAAILAIVIREWGETPDTLAAAFGGDRFAPAVLSDEEAAAFTRPNPFAGAPGHVAADLPEWVAPFVEENFGEEWISEGRALAERPPLDLRANTLKSSRDKLLAALKRFSPRPAAIARHGIRIEPGRRDARIPNVESEEGFRKGWFEVQDEGSQIVTALTGAVPGEQLLDLCAGAGGKTLAMAAAMENRGQIYAYDADRHRLAPIHERIARAGVRNVQVRAPGEGVLDDLAGKMDRVIIDAPCTGSGVWRRRPDAKWRLKPDQLTRRLAEQREVLAEATRFVRPGGMIAYITCSILPPENEAQVASFLAAHPDFTLASAFEGWSKLLGPDAPQPHSIDMKSVTLTPASTHTDGFFCSLLTRSVAP
ncbi:MAG: RsmB/NOP family class I SAM-dependent RNA methyltransferase [Cucumibacter sp.]